MILLPGYNTIDCPSLYNRYGEVVSDNCQLVNINYNRQIGIQYEQVSRQIGTTYNRDQSLLLNRQQYHKQVHLLEHLHCMVKSQMQLYVNTYFNSFGFQAILFLGQIVVSYFFAFILSIAFEAPIVSLLKLVSPTKRNNH